MYKQGTIGCGVMSQSWVGVTASLRSTLNGMSFKVGVVVECFGEGTQGGQMKNMTGFEEEQKHG